MFKSLWDDVSLSFKMGHTITRIIIINCFVFVIINIIGIFFGFGSSFFTTSWEFLSVSSKGWHMITHPWAIITHMFLHIEFWHLLWNMLFLYWFGRITGDLLGDHRILPIYILGGIMGFLFYYVTSLFGAFYAPFALGASAAVMAIVMVAGMTAPDYRLHLLFIGPVKLKYVVLTLIFLDIIGASGMVNSGGHVAHLGGVFMGWLFVILLQRGTDLSEPFNRVFDSIASLFRGIGQAKRTRRPKPSVAYTNKEKIKKKRNQKPHRQSDEENIQQRVDAILEKIKRHGMDSLTEEEKKILNDYRNILD